jgi:pyrimidine deaminase RibD-like protein/NTP pyrophosphatase (non-canonical NTP hydrolase)
MPSEADVAFMKEAIEEARKSKDEDGRAHPRVGVVITKDGQRLAAGFRGELGAGEHAEYTALERKLPDDTIAGATVYTTLEPCTTRNHPKVPCADRLIERKVARVYIGMLDPNPAIYGKGMERLTNAGVGVLLFTPELQDAVMEMNREFRRAQRREGQQDSVIPLALLDRRLDEWYRRVNSLYWNRNFQRDVTAIFTHLVEVAGGMSQLASNKQKPGAPPESFVPKAVAWWLALCGKVGVKSVEKMLWAKFPNACPYCQVAPHDNDVCQERKAQRRGPDWDALAALGREKAPPGRLGEWQRMFATVYQAQQTEDFGNSFARLTEEMGELAEAIRVFPAAPGYFLSEAADVFAWLMKVQNVVEQRAGVPRADRGKAIEREFARAYPDRCLDCGEASCACPPILPGTVGRIAHEVPGKRGTFGEEGYFMTNDRAAEVFGVTS